MTVDERKFWLQKALMKYVVNYNYHDAIKTIAVYSNHINDI